MPKEDAPPTIHGVYAALATPRGANSTEVDPAAFFDYMDGVVRAGVDGLVLFGSTGEFIHFDLSDRMHAVSLISKRSRVPVLVNVSHSTIEGTSTVAEGAIAAGVAGLLVMPPYFYRYTDEQLLAFFQHFGELVDGRIPVFLYNLPFFTNPLSFRVIESLLLSGEYAGIKDSSGDPDLFRQLNSLHAKAPFVWFAGNESLYLESRSAGADGIVSGVAGAVPELVVAMDRAIAAKNFDRARYFNELLLEFVAWLDKFPATIAIKQAAVVRDWKLDNAPFPFDETTRAEIRTFHRWFEEWLPRVLGECRQPTAAKA